MESRRVEAVTHQADRAIVVAEGTSGGRGEARGIIEAVAEAFPGLELAAHEQETAAHGALVWVGEPADAEALRAEFGRLRGPGGEWKLGIQNDVAFVSLIGLGLGAAEAARAEAALERVGVPLIALRVTPGALILRGPNPRVEEAARALHAAFLEAGDTRGPRVARQ
jgi:aspartokinase